MNILRSHKLGEVLSTLPDWSKSLGDSSSWNHGQVVPELALESDITCLAYDPVSSLLAISTSCGQINIFGNSSVYSRFRLRPPQKIKNLILNPPYIASIDAKDTIHVYDLGDMRDVGMGTGPRAQAGLDYRAAETPTGLEPLRIACHSLRSQCTCVESSPSLACIFLGSKDGTVDAFHLRRGATDYRIPNAWLNVEEITRKSGVPGAPSRRHIPTCMDLKINPTDLNQLLIAYEGGIVLWNIKEKRVLSYFELVIPPGAKGGHFREDELFTERRPGVTCIAWRFDGRMFIAGHSDGSLAFWSIDNSDRPILVRTLTELDVNMFDEASVFGTTTASTDSSTTASSSSNQNQNLPREPIFRLSWSYIPAQGEGKTCLIVLGGLTSTADEQQRISLIPFPELTAAIAGAESTTNAGREVLKSYCSGINSGPKSNNPGSGTETQQQQQGRSSSPTSASSPTSSTINSTSTSTSPNPPNSYRLPSPAEDFILLPKSSPHYDRSCDPEAIIILLSPPSPGLSESNTRTSIKSSRGVIAKEFSVYGDDGDVAVGFEGRPGSPPPPPPRTFSCPPQLEWTGKGSVRIQKLYDVPNHIYSKLVGHGPVGGEDAQHTDLTKLRPRLPLRGGVATPHVARGKDGRRIIPPTYQSRKILVTLHEDDTIRFYDASPQLLLEWNRTQQQSTVAGEGKGKLSSTPGGGFLGRLKDGYYPNELEKMRINLEDAIKSKSNQEEETAINFDLAVETLDLVVSLKKGDIIVYRFEVRTPAHLHHPDHQAIGEHHQEPEDAMKEAISELNLDTDSAVSGTSGGVVPPLPPPPPHSDASTIHSAASIKSPASPTSSTTSKRRIRSGTLLGGLKRAASKSERTSALVDHHPTVQELDILVDRFHSMIPRCRISKVHPAVFALSNFHFLAGMSPFGLWILDLDRLEWIMRDSDDHPHHTKDERSNNNEAAVDKPILCWSVCSTDESDDEVSPRLIALFPNGKQRTITLAHALDTWIVEPSTTTETKRKFSDPPIYMTVLGPQGQSTDRDLSGPSSSFFGENDDDPIKSFFFVATLDSIELYANVTGPRIEKVNVQTQDVILVRRDDAVALLVLGGRGAFAITLPKLSIEHLSIALNWERPWAYSCQDSEFISGNDVHSLFDYYGPRFPPSVNLLEGMIAPPAQPTNNVGLASVLSWFGATSTITTGKTIDEILAGPEPEPEPEAVARQGVKSPPMAQNRMAAAGDARDNLDLARDALEERGEKLSMIEERFKDIGQASNDMIKEAKRLAAQQSAKKTFGGWFG